MSANFTSFNETLPFSAWIEISLFDDPSNALNVAPAKLTSPSEAFKSMSLDCNTADSLIVIDSAFKVSACVAINVPLISRISEVNVRSFPEAS